MLPSKCYKIPSHHNLKFAHKDFKIIIAVLFLIFEIMQPEINCILQMNTFKERKSEYILELKKKTKNNKTNSNHLFRDQSMTLA